MAHIDDFFPSKYLKASDLQGRDVKVTIQSLIPEQFENDGKTDTKLVVYFVGKEKGVVLNKTNAGTIAAAYGYDYTTWSGNQITLYTAMVDAWGETKEAIRIRVTAENMRAVNPGVPQFGQPQPQGPADSEMSQPEPVHAGAHNGPPPGNTSLPGDEDDLPF